MVTIHKGGTQNQPENRLPSSLTNILSKRPQKLVNKHLSQYWKNGRFHVKRTVGLPTVFVHIRDRLD